MVHSLIASCLRKQGASHFNEGSFEQIIEFLFHWKPKLVAPYVLDIKHTSNFYEKSDEVQIKVGAYQV